MPSSPQPQQADARRSVDHPLTPEAQFLAKYGGFVSPDAAGLPAVLQHQHTRKYQGQSRPSCSLREYSALQGVVRRSSQRRTHIAQTRFATTNFSLSCLSQPWQHGRCCGAASCLVAGELPALGGIDYQQPASAVTAVKNSSLHTPLTPSRPVDSSATTKYRLTPAAASHPSFTEAVPPESVTLNQAKTERSLEIWAAVIRRCKCQQLSKAWHVWAAHTSAHHVHTHTHVQLGLIVEKAECDKDEGNVSALPVSTPSNTTRSGPDAVVSLPPAQAPKGPPGRRTMRKLLQDIAASELRKVLEERKRQYACHICHKAYACSDTLAVHMRLDHTNTLASRSAARGPLPSTSLSSRHARHLGEEGEEWIPPVRQVIEGTSTTNAVCGGHCDALGGFFVSKALERGMRASDYVMAIGQRDSVSIWALETGEVDAF